MKNLKLKAARAAKDLSQQALADIVGVSRQTVNAIEKGDYNPSIKLCISICKALDRTLDELFWEELHVKSQISMMTSSLVQPAGLHVKAGFCRCMQNGRLIVSCFSV